MGNDYQLDAGRAAIDAAIGEPTEASALVRAKCRGLLAGYHDKYHDAGWVTIGTEQTFHQPVVNPTTGAKSRTFTHAGKFDGIVSYRGQPWLLEHKTTSQDISEATAPYWRQLAIDSQVSGYMLAHWQGGEKLAGTLYDVIRKPTIKPKQVPLADKRFTVASMMYFKRPMSYATLDYLASTREAPAQETAEMYEARLAADTLERAQHYFQRRPIYRLDQEIAEYADELWHVSKQILDARKTEMHYRNSGACMLYNSPCEYLGICSGSDSPDSDRWSKRGEIHGELDLDGNHSNVLTHTRLRCFQTCRRKHLYRYEIGLKRRDEEEREALYFGSVFHAGLDAWWSCFKEPDNGNDNRRSVIGIESAGESAIYAR